MRLRPQSHDDGRAILSRAEARFLVPPDFPDLTHEEELTMQELEALVKKWRELDDKYLSDYESAATLRNAGKLDVLETCIYELEAALKKIKGE